VLLRHRAAGHQNRQHGRQHRAHQPCPVISNHWSSVTTSTPRLSACLSLLPAPGPATTRSVLAETDPETLAPSRSAIALASARVMRSRLPVNTTVLPTTTLSAAIVTT